MDVYLYITGGFFLFFGVNGLLRPQQSVAYPFSMVADDIDARHYLRAGAGGVTVALALLFIAGGLVPQLGFTSLVCAVVVMAGLLLGRVTSLILDGRPSTFIFGAAFGELLGVVFGLFWLSQIP